jgi:hypothetical protein
MEYGLSGEIIRVFPSVASCLPILTLVIAEARTVVLYGLKRAARGVIQNAGQMTKVTWRQLLKLTELAATMSTGQEARNGGRLESALR